MARRIEVEIAFEAKRENQVRKGCRGCILSPIAFLRFMDEAANILSA